MSDATYNGWANYPTWAVNMWIENEEWSYREACDLAERFCDEGECDNYGLAQAIEAWIDERFTPDLGASMATDVFGWAMAHVDYREIAEHWGQAALEALSE